MSYAKTTTVKPERSRAEIERLLSRYGADQFAYGTQPGRAMIGFRANRKFVQFILPLPLAADERFFKGGLRAGYRDGVWGRWRTDAQAAEAYEQEIRRLWRALALVIKAKLEAVESGITSFESEFMAHIVLPDGRSVGSYVLPAIEDAYETGKVRGLLPEFVE